MGTPPAQELSNLTFVHIHFENSAEVPVAFRKKFLMRGKSLQKGLLRSSGLESPLPKAISCCLGRQGLQSAATWLADFSGKEVGEGRKDLHAPSWQRNLTPRPTAPLAASTHSTGWGMMPYTFSSLSNRFGYSQADTWEKAECSSLQQQKERWRIEHFSYKSFHFWGGKLGLFPKEVKKLNQNLLTLLYWNQETEVKNCSSTSSTTASASKVLPLVMGHRFTELKWLAISTGWGLGV